MQPNRKWVIQNGGLNKSIACIFASRQDNNEIPTAMPMFSGSSFSLGHPRRLCDRTGIGKIQDGGLWTSNACISAPRQDINEIPTAILVFRGLAFHEDSWKYTMRPNQKGKNSRLRPLNFYCVSLRSQTRYQRNSNGYTYVLRSSIPLELVGMMCDQIWSGKHKMFRKCKTVWLVFWYWHPYDN